MPPTDPATLSPGQLATLMHFYADAGVDCMLAETPIDRVEESRTARAARPGPIVSPAAARDAQPAAPGPGATPALTGLRETTVSAAPATPTLAVPDEAALRDAREAARQASSIEDLRAILTGFNGCNLKFSAKNLVFADGNPKAEIMFVGEAPGREEDIQGLPFIGRAGQLLDRMLAAIGLDRSTAYITNMIFWRPPGNRTPTPHELALCRPFTERHIELAAPKIIVFLGNVATKGMLETNKGILSIRGSWTDYRAGERTIPALPTLHPAYLLRNPAHKKLAWRDLLSLRARLDQPE